MISSIFLGDLFSSFDYSTSGSSVLEFLGNLNWLFSVLIFVFFINKINLSVIPSFLRNKNNDNPHNSNFNFYFFSLFVFLVGLNLIGLAPYLFSSTSHIFFVFFVSFCFWGSLFLSNLMAGPLKFSYLFFPSSPGFILPFLNLIEIVSFFIRPLTLMLRLSINITTGHIFVVLLSSCFTFLFLSGSFLTLFVFPISMFLFFFESCIGVVQGVVFFLLLQSYMGEHQ